MTASSPASPVLASFPPPALARLVGIHIDQDYAAVYVVTGEGADWLSLLRKDDEGWAEALGSNGGQLWINTADGPDETPPRGVLACAVPVQAPGDYLVHYGDKKTTVRAAQPYAVAVLLDVAASDTLRVTRISR